MAQIAQETTLRARIDHYLAYLTDEWAAIPDLAAEWADWEDHERLDFEVEWPLREDRLRQLRQWSTKGLLTAEQQTRYAGLQGLIERYRSVLERLLTG